MSSCSAGKLEFPTTTPDQTAGRSCEQTPCARVTLRLRMHVQEEGASVGTGVARAHSVAPNTSTDSHLWMHRAFCYCFTPSQKSECAFPTILISPNPPPPPLTDLHTSGDTTPPWSQAMVLLDTWIIKKKSRILIFVQFRISYVGYRIQNLTLSSWCLGRTSCV